MYDDDVPYGNQLHGKTITIINRSEVVGRPLAALLANDGAKVYSVDINDILEFHRGDVLEHYKYIVEDCTKTLEEILPVSDIVITGVPSKDYRAPVHLLKGKSMPKRMETVYQCLFLFQTELWLSILLVPRTLAMK